MSGPGSQGRQTLQPLQPPDPEQWLMVVRPPCCTKLGLLSSANSAQAQEMQLLMPSSSAGTRSSSNSARRATSSAKSRSEKECGPKDTPVEPVSTVLSSNQSTPVAKESGANTNPWRTPVSIVNQELSDCDARTQLTELLYRALIKLTILSVIPSLVNNNQSEDRLSEVSVAIYNSVVMYKTALCWHIKPNLPWAELLFRGRLNQLEIQGKAFVKR